MPARHRELSTNGFRHLSRQLQEGENLPRLPTLLEQVLACRFESGEDDPDEAVQDDDWDPDLDDLS